VQCLDILSSQCAKPSFAKTISDVTHEVGLAVARRLGDESPHLDRVLAQVRSLLGA
jgi:hypothetical protein